MTRETVVIVSIDTEEDNWCPSRNGVAVGNVRKLERLGVFFDRLGVRPTYLVNYQVAIEPCAVATLRDLYATGTAEIGAHLHPWNTPPLAEAFIPRNTMLKNLPAHLQLAKLERLTDVLEQAFDRTPRVFRAGRFGFGRGTVAALLHCGYRVDSSVTPFWNWEWLDNGPSFVGAPLGPYRLDPHTDATRPAANGDLLEIPLSYGFSRGPFSFWDPVRRLLEAAPFRWFHLAGIGSRAGLARRIVLSPELASAADMLTLSQRLLEHGVRHLQVFWHSPALTPGLTPFVATAADVRRMFDSIEAYFDGLSRITNVRFATISEAAAMLM